MSTTPPFVLIESDWERELTKALRSSRDHWRWICPFIQGQTVQRLLKAGQPRKLHVITRFKLSDCAGGVHDLRALRLLVEHGAQVRGVRELHTKLYVAGNRQAIITSANLTAGGLGRNLEFGLVAHDRTLVEGCVEYFDRMWAQAGEDLTEARLDKFEREVAEYLAGQGVGNPPPEPGDYGVSIGRPAREQMAAVADTGKGAVEAYVKFQGASYDRFPSNTPTLESIQRSGCHWGVGYPKGKRPGVKDGALMFISRLTTADGVNDIRIFGRATAQAYRREMDDASAADIELRPWKEKWPHTVRVHHTEFLDATLGESVSFNELMNELQEQAFATTQANAARGIGNINPRRTYMRQAAVRLSPQGVEWLNKKLDAAIARHGLIPQAKLAELDWPAQRARGASAS